MQIQHSQFHDQLIRGLSHKMNNYLSLFQGFLNVLLEDKRLDEETLAGLAQIRVGAAEASELLDRTRSLASPSSLIWHEIDLVKFMRSLTPILERMAVHGRVDVDYPDALPHVVADPARLRVAIKEVVKNACESVENVGLVSIRVLGESELPEPTRAFQSLYWVSIDVHDDGPGIPPELHGKIFQPFFTTRKRAHATGLGLTVANELMQQMKGMLRFESEPGNTNFHLLLPAKTQKF
jgi:two-component system cell cycle sensor histidine kinase/response regulator CckA